MQVEVHELTNDPNSAWKEISKKQRVKIITMKQPKSEIPKNKVRVVCMSDTHSLTHKISFDVPDGDLFIHAGDFTSVGKKEEVMKFNEWIGNDIFDHIFECLARNIDCIDLQVCCLISINWSLLVIMNSLSIVHVHIPLKKYSTRRKVIIVYVHELRLRSQNFCFHFYQMTLQLQVLRSQTISTNI